MLINKSIPWDKMNQQPSSRAFMAHLCHVENNKRGQEKVVQLYNQHSNHLLTWSKYDKPSLRTC